MIVKGGVPEANGDRYFCIIYKEIIAKKRGGLEERFFFHWHQNNRSNFNRISLLKFLYGKNSVTMEGTLPDFNSFRLENPFFPKECIHLPGLIGLAATGVLLMVFAALTFKASADFDFRSTADFDLISSGADLILRFEEALVVTAVVTGGFVVSFLTGGVVWAFTPNNSSSEPNRVNILFILFFLIYKFLGTSPK